jgi:argininosuccinate lyase
VKKGMPFRDAHEVVALAVKHGVNTQQDLAQMTLEELKGFSQMISEDVYSVLTLEGSVASRNHVGGTAPTQVRNAIQQARATFT